MEIGEKNSATFHEAVGAVIRTSAHFPTVAAVLAEYDHRAARQRVETPQLTAGEAYEMGVRNAARLAREGLPSDAMLARGGGRVHAVGSPEHRAILAMYDRLIRVLEGRVNEREQESQARPHDTDVQRRMLVLIRTLSETQERRRHFAETGETLALGGLVSA